MDSGFLRFAKGRQAYTIRRNLFSFSSRSLQILLPPAATHLHSQSSAKAAMNHPAPAKPMVTDVFVKGAVQGWNICVTSTIPNVLMAFVIIKILNHSGLLALIGQIFSPIMGIFGLPGEAATVLLGGWMSMGGGVGVAVALFDNGVLNGTQLAIVCPAIFLMGSQIQYLGRCLGVIGIKGSKIPLIMAIPVLTAFVSLFVMRILMLGN